MTKLVVAIDIDEVLAPFNERILAHYNQVDGTHLQVHQYGPVDFDVLWGVSDAEAIARFNVYHREGHSARHEPMPESMAALDVLGQYYDLVVVTSRQSEFRQLSIDWVERHYPRVFNGVHMANYWDGHLPRLSKAQICRQLGAVVLVDDDLRYVGEAAEAGVRGLLFGSYTWNQADELPDGVERVQNWDDVVTKLIKEAV